jgi:hypothetical protein
VKNAEVSEEDVDVAAEIADVAVAEDVAREDATKMSGFPSPSSDVSLRRERSVPLRKFSSSPSP